MAQPIPVVANAVFRTWELSICGMQRDLAHGVVI